MNQCRYTLYIVHGSSFHTLGKDSGKSYNLGLGILDPGILDQWILEPGLLDPGILEPGLLDPGILEPGLLDPWDI